MDTKDRARKTKTALGIFALTVALVGVPLVSATNVDLTDTSVSVPISNPNPPSAEEQVQEGAESVVSTGSNTAQSASPLAQASPLPTPGLTAPPIPAGSTNGDACQETLISQEECEEEEEENRVTVVNPTSSVTPGVRTTSPSDSSAKCPTCTPNLKAKASGLASVVDEGAGAAAEAAGDRTGAGETNPDYKDLTQDGEATPPAAVPGFGPAFALAGLALLVWVRRRTSG